MNEEKLQNGGMSLMEYVLQTEEYSRDYTEYCRERGKRFCDGTAQEFLDFLDSEIASHQNSQE